MSTGVVNGRLSDNVPRLAVPNGIGFYAAGALGLAVVLSAAGAYDTDELTILHRSILWTTVLALIVGQAAALHEAFARFGATHGGKAGFGAAAAVIATIVLVTLELHAMKYTPLLPKEPDPILEFVLFISLLVLPIAGFVVLARLAQGRGRMSSPRDCPGPSANCEVAQGRPPPSAAEPLLEEWPALPVSYVRAVDHYLEVTCGVDRHLVRGRMKDAVSLLAEADGLQVHRSWWVARREIVRIETTGRDKAIVLRDGCRVPVARSRATTIRWARHRIDWWPRIG